MLTDNSSCKVLLQDLSTGLFLLHLFISLFSETERKRERERLDGDDKNKCKKGEPF